MTRWWATSLDGAVHLVHDGDPVGVITARCGDVLPAAVRQYDQPPLGPPCEPCRMSFLADFTTTRS